MKSLRWFCCLFCLFFLMASAHAAPRYRITDLGVPPGYQASYATCLNDKGQVAGDVVCRRQISERRQNGTTAFLWGRGRMHLLPSSPLFFSGKREVCDAVASGINNHGQVVGTLSSCFDGAWMGIDIQAVLWDQGRILKLLRLPWKGGMMDQNTAISINDAEQVAGTADENGMGDVDDQDKNFSHIFLYANGRIRNEGPGVATGLNPSGQISGYVLLNKAGQPAWDHSDADFITHSQAILCQPNGVRLTLGRGYALNLNGSGSVIGTNEAAVDADGPVSLRTQVTDALAARMITRRQVFGRGHSHADIISLPKTIAGRHALILFWRTGRGRSRASPLPIHWSPRRSTRRGRWSDVAGSGRRAGPTA